MTFESVSWPKEFQTEVIIGRRVLAEASNAWLLFGTGIAGSPRPQALCCLVHEARGLSIQTFSRVPGFFSSGDLILLLIGRH
jgi:hypothetical protein